MGLIVVVLTGAFYYAELLFAMRFLRSRLLVRNAFIYLLVLALSACVLMIANFVAHLWVLKLIGFDIEFAGAGFVYMGATISSMTIMVLLIGEELWRVFRTREKR